MALRICLIVLLSSLGLLFIFINFAVNAVCFNLFHYCFCISELNRMNELNRHLWHCWFFWYALLLTFGTSDRFNCRQRHRLVVVFNVHVLSSLSSPLSISIVTLYFIACVLLNLLLFTTWQSLTS